MWKKSFLAVFLILFLPVFIYPATIQAVELNSDPDKIQPRDIKVEATDINENGFCEDFTISFTVDSEVYSGWQVGGKILDKDNQRIYYQRALCRGGKECDQRYGYLFSYGVPGEREYTIHFKTEELKKDTRLLVPVKLIINIARKIPAHSENIIHEELALDISSHNCQGFEEEEKALTENQTGILAEIKSLIDQNKYSEASKLINKHASRYNWDVYPNYNLYKAQATEKLGNLYDAALIYKAAGYSSDYQRIFISLWSRQFLLLVLGVGLILLVYKLFRFSRVILIYTTLLFLGNNLSVLIIYPGGCPSGGLECLGIIIIPFFFTAVLTGAMWFVLIVTDFRRFLKQEPRVSSTELIRRNAALLPKFLFSIIIIYLIDVFIFYPISSAIWQSESLISLFKSYLEYFLIPRGEVSIPPLISILFSLIVNPVTLSLLLGIAIWKLINFLNKRSSNQ